jgi:hypothetical protein
VHSQRDWDCEVLPDTPDDSPSTVDGRVPFWQQVVLQQGSGWQCSIMHQHCFYPFGHHFEPVLHRKVTLCTP